MNSISTTHHESLSKVILSFPSMVQLAPDTAKEKTPRSWIQLARVGSFVSKRYGKFAITRDDLSQMYRNFNEITPKFPTELPIDFDHLSMDPKKPGDGIAAGWMKRLELRESGDELWAEVEWTPDAAQHITKGEYRFVSPSFVKDHTHKDGTKIGTTLLAAAITNHPFLEGMKALTLYNFSALGDLAVLDAGTTARAVHLAEVGQRVTFKDDDDATPELTPDERAQSFTVKATVGEGDDQFLRLTTVDGTPFGWFRADQLAPARAPNIEKENPMSAKTTADPMQQLMADAQQLVAASGGRMHLNDAYKAVSLRNPALTRDYFEQVGAASAVLAETTAEPPVVNPHSLHRDPDEGFAELVTRVSRERRIDLRDANRLASEAYPTLAAAYARGETL